MHTIEIPAKILRNAFLPKSSLSIALKKCERKWEKFCNLGRREPEYGDFDQICRNMITIIWIQPCNVLFKY